MYSIKNDIFKDNMEKYSDPLLYDIHHKNFMKDFPLILEYAKKQQGHIIELACGTGRLTIPLCETGYSITGVDINEGMLKRAKEKAKEKKLEISWLLQDCTKLSIEKLADFIFMTGNSFQHFLTNESQNQLLQSVYNHLQTNGIFIFDTRYPNLSELATIDEYVETYTDSMSRMITEFSSDTYNPLTQILFCESKRETINEDGTKKQLGIESISLRYVFPMEMERLLEHNGFTILEKYGSWEKEPLCDKHCQMIYVCQKTPK